MPRVISGSCGGLRLKTPKHDHTRPTADRTKEAMFSILNPMVDWMNCNVLELFAGSGQLAIEALSRGARFAILVEKDRQVARLIRDNLAHCGLSDRAQVWACQALTSVNRLVTDGFKWLNEEKMSGSADLQVMRLKSNGRFQLILMDPPYHIAIKSAVEIFRLLDEADLIEEGGILMLEHPIPSEKDQSDYHLLLNLPHFKLIKSCQYGVAVLSFFVYDPSNS